MPRCSATPSGPRWALPEEGTRLADAHQGVSDETWAKVRKHDDDLSSPGVAMAEWARVRAATNEEGNRLLPIVRRRPVRW
jgi:hypothetical protein